MTVRDLRETLTQVVGLLRAADAKAATVNGLAEFIAATASFGELNLKQFVKYAEDGRSPAPPKSATTPKSRPGKSSPDPTAVEQEVVGLYQRAGDPTVTEEQIRASCAKLASLKKDSLLRVAAAIGLEGMGGKTIKVIAGAITDRLVDRKSAAIRGKLIDRPPQSSGVHADSPPTGN